jgi:hypothetical protein
VQLGAVSVQESLPTDADCERQRLSDEQWRREQAAYDAAQERERSEKERLHAAAGDWAQVLRTQPQLRSQVPPAVLAEIKRLGSMAVLSGVQSNSGVHYSDIHPEGIRT